MMSLVLASARGAGPVDVLLPNSMLLHTQTFELRSQWQQRHIASEKLRLELRMMRWHFAFTLVLNVYLLYKRL